MDSVNERKLLSSVSLRVIKENADVSTFCDYDLVLGRPPSTHHSPVKKANRKPAGNERVNLIIRALFL